MIRRTIKHQSPPAELVTELSQRDAALWLGSFPDLTKDRLSKLAELAALTWRSVLAEDNSPEFIDAIEHAANTHSDLKRTRGLISLIARDPEGIQLPQQSLPILLLNGREGSTDPLERPALGTRTSLRRRLNMTKRLAESRPRSLVLLLQQDSETISELMELWQEGLQPNIFVVSVNPSILRLADEWIASGKGPPTATLIELEPIEFAAQLQHEFQSTIDTSRLVVRLRTPNEIFVNIDVTNCEQPEYPILDRFDLIRAQDLRRIGIEDLTDDDFTGFFERSAHTWRPYAAGLPWVRDGRIVDDLHRKLFDVAAGGHDSTTLVVVPSEQGAGGSTLAHQLAFAAANMGFPTLVAKQAKFEARSTEISTFLYRLRQEYLAGITSVPSQTTIVDSYETATSNELPALLVFDVQHWLGREEKLTSFVRDLTRESRAAIVLAVVTPDALDKIPNSLVLTDILQHEISQSQAIELGEHLNRFLRTRKRDRTKEEWTQFWMHYSPRIGDFAATPASFWLALEFWLKFQIDISESVQSWLYTQYKEANISKECRFVIMQIAALSLERQILPETMLPNAVDGEFPLSYQLDEARRNLPALGLVRNATADARQWYIGHALLARYLLGRLFQERIELDQLDLGAARDPVELRLLLLKSVATDSKMAMKIHRKFGIEFAQTILKLDRDGNRELFVHWRELVAILEEMPDSLWDTSRTFNHHVAISRRRLVNDKDLFALTSDERDSQIRLAIEHLEYALTQLQADHDDERDLNILNSLARAYHDCADIGVSRGVPSIEIEELRAKATDAIRRALSENPNNSFVLETVARDLLESTTQISGERIGRACEALGFLQRAMSLDCAELRSSRISNLVIRALEFLRSSGINSEITQLRIQGDALGNLACAWLYLFADTELQSPLSVALVPRSNQERALSALRQIQRGCRKWMDLRLEYELVSSLSPFDFKAQLDILDVLFGTSFHADIQLRVEYAILLYQCGRVYEGSTHFRTLRKEIAQAEVYVIIPERMRVLRDLNASKPMICEALVFDEGGFRSRARIKDFKSEVVPFIPRDFGQKRMPPGMTFHCSIVFGPNGPFARPIRE